MLQHRVAFHALEHPRRETAALRIGRDIDARHRNRSRFTYPSTRAPAPHRCTDSTGQEGNPSARRGFINKGRRRLQHAPQPATGVAPW